MKREGNITTSTLSCAKAQLYRNGNHLRRADTTAPMFRLRRSEYVWPQPTNTIGWPVMYVMETAAPTYIVGMKWRQRVKYSRITANGKAKSTTASRKLERWASNYLIIDGVEFRQNYSIYEASRRSWCCVVSKGLQWIQNQLRLQMGVPRSR